jgi:antitoxin YefM
MKTATLTDFRQKMKKHLDGIQRDHDFLVLTGLRQRDFVVLTLQEFNSMEETAYLMSTQANAQHLMESVAQAKAGKAKVRNVNLDSGKTNTPARKSKKNSD